MSDRDRAMRAGTWVRLLVCLRWRRWETYTSWSFTVMAATSLLAKKCLAWQRPEGDHPVERCKVVLDGMRGVCVATSVVTAARARGGRRFDDGDNDDGRSLVNSLIAAYLCSMRYRRSEEGKGVMVGRR